jgi:hypothetical protein
MAQAAAYPQVTQDADQGQVAQKVYGALKDAPVSDAVRAQAWDAFTKANSPQDFKKAFDPIKGLSDSVKGALWDFKKPSWGTGQGDLPPGAPPPPQKPSAQEQPWYNRAIIPLDKLVAGPDKSQPWYEQFGRGVVQGGAESGANLTSPKNLLVMGGMAAANAIPYVGEAVDAAASLFMGTEQIESIINSGPDIKKAFRANDWGELGNLIGKDAASALATYKTAQHAAGGKLAGKVSKGRSASDTTPAGANRTPPPPPGAPPTYPLIEAGTQKALGQGQPQTGPFNMPGEPGQPQGNLPAGQPNQPALPGGQQPLQLPPASQIQLPGTPTARPMPGAPQSPSGLLIEQGGPSGSPPPPGANLARPEANPQAAEPGTGSTPVSRQIGDGSGPITYEQYLEHAKTLPKDQLAHNVQQMTGGMMQRAEALPKAQRAEFLKQAKAYLKPFEDLLGEGGEEPKSNAPTEKAGPKPKKDMKKEEPESDVGPASPEMASRVKNQLDSFKAKGIKTIKITIDRGPNQKPAEIGVNTDIDTPESVAAKIAKYGVKSGKHLIESTDKDHPVSYKFSIGEGDTPAPPGAK